MGTSAAAAAAVAFGISVLVPSCMQAALANEASSIARHHHFLQRHAHYGVESGATPVASDSPAWALFQGSFNNPFATPPRPLEWPHIAPYPPGQGDTDGLSRNPDDCNKGCIDNGP